MSTIISQVTSSRRSSMPGQYTLNLKSVQLNKKFALYVTRDDRIADIQKFLRQLDDIQGVAFKESRDSLALPYHLTVKEIAGQDPCQFDLYLEITSVQKRKVDACCKCRVF